MWAVGAPESAFRLRGITPEAHSRNVWALLGTRQVDVDQVLAVWLAVCMAHEADLQPERKLEYRHVQSAKVLEAVTESTVVVGRQRFNFAPGEVGVVVQGRQPIYTCTWRMWHSINHTSV